MRSLLAWYAAQPVLRMVVRWLPFGTGNALDVALIAVQHALLVNPRRRD